MSDKDYGAHWPHTESSIVDLIEQLAREMAEDVVQKRLEEAKVEWAQEWCKCVTQFRKGD